MVKKWTPPKKPIVRQPGWETRLVTQLSHLMQTPFAWGISDCLIMQAEICRAMTGVNFLPAQYRTYRTAAGAQKMLLKAGFRSVEQALDAVFDPVPVALARRGDCGLVRYERDGIEAEVAATLFGQFACTRTETGQQRLPWLKVSKAWRVG